MLTKYCPSCKTSKDPAQFYKDGTRSDGRHQYCMECSRTTHKPNQRTDTFREYAKQRYQKNKVRVGIQAKVRNAVKSGLIIKPTECEHCGGIYKLDGHHEDYSKPLDVIWLCDICHKDRHGKILDKSLLRYFKG